MDPVFIDLLARGGSFVILASVIWAMWTEKLVPGSRMVRLEAEKEEWKRLAVELLRTADRAVKLVEGPGL